MNTFNESDHPRNKGKFTDKIQSEATNVSLGTVQGSRLEDYTSPEKFVEMAVSSAAHWSRIYGLEGQNGAKKSNHVSNEDVAQETIARVLEHVKKGNKVTDFRQFVNSTAANVAVRSTENVFRADDRKAYRIFTAERTAAEHLLNRSLTQVEQDKIAQKVLDEWEDRRHKPSKDFRTPRTVDTSLDKNYMGDDNDGRTLGAGLAAPESSGHYIEPDSFMDRAHSALETTGAAHKAEAKRLAWNAIAERADVPLALQSSLSQRQVTKHRSVMGAYAKNDEEKPRDPVMAACRDWSNDRDNEATEAMFAPFGQLNIQDQEKVVEMFERFGEGRAQIMWESAIGFSNNKHSKEEVMA